MENELLKEAVEYGRAKVDSARAAIAGDGCKLSQPLSPGVACAVARHSPDEPMTGWMAAAVVTLMIRMCFLRIPPHVIGELPTYGYRRYGRCVSQTGRT